MLRAAVFTLLAASTLTGLCKRSEQAGHFMAMLLDCLFAQVLSGSAVFQRDSFRSAASQTDSPDYEPFWYEQPYAETVTGWPAPPVVIQPRDEGRPWTSETPSARPQVIEVPGVANSTTAKTLPPTIFILTNGERLETRRFVLTASNLSASLDRHQRTIPLDMLDINARFAANREREIDLRVAADRNEISLSF
jgi:hypothetical protein